MNDCNINKECNECSWTLFGHGMCVCVCACVRACAYYVYIYMYVCSCVCVCAHILYIYIYIYILYIYRHTHTHTHTHTNLKKAFTDREIHTRVYIHTTCIIQCEYNTHFHFCTLQNPERHTSQSPVPSAEACVILFYWKHGMPRKCLASSCLVTIFLSIYSRDQWKPCSTADWRLG